MKTFLPDPQRFLCLETSFEGHGLGNQAPFMAPSLLIGASSFCNSNRSGPGWTRPGQVSDSSTLCERERERGFFVCLRARGQSPAPSPRQMGLGRASSSQLLPLRGDPRVNPLGGMPIRPTGGLPHTVRSHTHTHTYTHTHIHAHTHTHTRTLS